MHAAFESIHNHHEHLVMDAVMAASPDHPGMDDEDLLADVMCIALNRVRPRYIRHEIDLAFYQTHEEREAIAAEIAESVNYALAFVAQRRMADSRA